MGDPAGVGPELCLQLIQRENDTCQKRGVAPVIIGDAGILKRVAVHLNRPLDVPVVRHFDALGALAHRAVVLDVPEAWEGDQANAIVVGKDQKACGAAAACYIERAARACLARHVSAMVTAPISKHALTMAGLRYPGHTEMLADLTASKSIAMLLYSEAIAVALVTTHQSLRSVPDALEQDRIVEVATHLDTFLRRLRPGRPPRLAVLGLNPHAGENGLFGLEEKEIVAPAIERMRAHGIEAEGPLPPDTAFTPHALARYDGHVVMYHDQGLIPFKMRAFDCGVNVTLGLKIIRTSPDHGTAFDIAWQGKVRPDSFFAAYDLAVRLASNEGAGA